VRSSNQGGHAAESIEGVAESLALVSRKLLPPGMDFWLYFCPHHWSPD